MTTRIDVRKLIKNALENPTALSKERLYATYDFCILVNDLDAAKELGSEIIKRVSTEFLHSDEVLR